MEINVVMVVVVLFLACMLVKGYKTGLIKEVISLVALVIAVVAISLIAVAVESYFNSSFLSMVLAITCFVVLLLVVQLAKLIFSSIEFLSKLPIINWLNKIAGSVLGIAEGIVFIWFVFILLQFFEFGGVSAYALNLVDQSEFLSYLYNHNYVAILALEIL